MRAPDTILGKPIVISSCQQFIKSETHNSNLTTHHAYKLFSQPWDSSHKVWLFHMVDFGLFHGLTHLAMPQTIYLKPKLQSAKHLVSLDAYNFFHCCNNHWSIFRIYKIQTIPAVNRINITKTHLLHAIIIILKFARYSYIIHAIKWNV